MTEIITQIQQGKYCFKSEKPFVFSSGRSLPCLELVFETYGKLNANKDNVILIHHALSTSSHVTSHDEQDTPGWWEKWVGPNRPIDTNLFYVICINNLGSCFGSSGPNSLHPQTNKNYGNDFPELILHDIVMAQKLLLEALAIDKLYALIGPSMGGMIALDFALTFPTKIKKLILISSAARAYPFNIGLRTIQRDIIQLDPNWQAHDQNLSAGFKLSRKLAQLTYRSSQELNQRFSMAQERNIHTYLEYNAEKFVQRFNVWSYLRLTAAMDIFDVREQLKQLKGFFPDTLVISASSDYLFEPEQQYEIVQSLLREKVNVAYHCYATDYGHDAFLVEEGMAEYVKQKLLAE